MVEGGGGQRGEDEKNEMCHQLKQYPLSGVLFDQVSESAHTMMFFGCCCFFFFKQNSLNSYSASGFYDSSMTYMYTTSKMQPPRFCCQHTTNN